MNKIKHISGAEYDVEKLKVINEVFVNDCEVAGIPCFRLTVENIDKVLHGYLLSKRESLKTLGIQVSEEQIRKELNLKWPWWKRWLMFSKRKKLERAKIILDLITGKQNE